MESDFDIDAFGDLLESTMADLKVVGYSYCIMKNTDPKDPSKWSKPRSNGLGLAVSKTNAAATILYNYDPFNHAILTGLPQSANQKMEIQSISKTITAAAAMKLLEQKEININSPVWPYLPVDWVSPKPAFGIDKLSFRHLLEHKSGLQEFYDIGNGKVASLNNRLSGQTSSDGSKYHLMKISIQNGLSDIPGNFPYVYRNINYALFRIIIPYIYKKSDLEQFRGNAQKALDNGFPQLFDGFKDYLGGEYVRRVNELILNPGLGVINNNANIFAPEPRTRYYNADDLEHDPSDGDFDDALDRCGGNCWKLSATEYCDFLINLIGNKFGPLWERMRKDRSGDHYIGLDPKRYIGSYGEYFGKTGTGIHSRTVWLWFPSIPALKISAVVAVLMINSAREDDFAIENSPVNILGSAYENAVLASIPFVLNTA